MFAVLVSGAVAALWVAWLDAELVRRFEGERWRVPAHVYSRPLELYAGLALTPGALADELERRGYRADHAPSGPGSYRRVGERIELVTRPFPVWRGTEGSVRAVVDFAGGRVAGLRDPGGSRVDVKVEPRLLGSIVLGHHEDRVVIALDDAPPLLVDALLAIEDRRFRKHHGIDLRGLARAAWANLRAGAWVQGGSTVTQQLAKNLFLSPERTLRRKLTEMAMAWLLELRYDKTTILEAYLNEVFLGQAGARAIHGFGLAAQFYFDRPLRELAPGEIALLVAMIKGPSAHDPRRHPERARARRDLVLHELERHGVLSARVAGEARRAGLGVTAWRGRTRQSHPAFMDLARRQLLHHHFAQELESEGLVVHTTLDPRVQRVAEDGLGSGLERIERARGMTVGSLQGAVVVVQPATGEVLALVGDRRAHYAGFNRALDAVRPIGSLVKPAVLLAALERPDTYTLATPVDDRAFTVRGRDGNDWSPRNYDGKFHGDVALVDAVARSYNVALARVGVALGVPRVADTLHRLGVRRDLPAYPSLVLGAASLAPIEVAQMYLTLASGGLVMPLRAALRVYGQDGGALARYPLGTDRTADEGVVHLVNHALGEAVRRGTGAGLARLLPPGTRVAGKTGTTNDYRDSWFAGFSRDHLTVVWVGRDDNRPTGLSGSAGAMVIWGEVMARLGTRGLVTDPPADVVLAPVAGERGCAAPQTLPFLAHSVPARLACGPAPDRATGSWLRRLLARLGRGDDRPDTDAPADPAR